MSPCDESDRLPGLSPLASLPFETKEAVILGLDRPGVNMLGSLYEHMICATNHGGPGRVPDPGGGGLGWWK